MARKGKAIRQVGSWFEDQFGPEPLAQPRSTIRGMERKYKPGIYQDPRQLLAEAQAQMAPESPWLSRLFGTTRSELAQIADRSGNMPVNLPGAKANPRGTQYAHKVMTPSNTNRLVDAIGLARDTPLGVGMRGWYVQDPLYHRMEQLVGPDQARLDFNQLNNITGIHSANSAVDKELVRGSAANWLLKEGRLDDYLQYGNSANRTKADASGMMRPERPVDMDAIPGHFAHSTAHTTPMMNYLNEGRYPGTAKVPAYMQASGVPETGFQTEFPVGDAHYSRAIGLADVRPPTKGKPGESWTMTEAQQLAPWWRDQVAAQVDLESVPAQAVTWGLYAPQTGVQTAIGAPKLEIMADLIGERTAPRLGVSPEVARDMVLMGKTHAGFADPSLLKWLGLGAGAAYVGSGLLEDEVEESGVAERFRPRLID